MRFSNEIDKLAEALAAAQGEIEGAVKGNTNPAFRSKYADLGAVWDAIRAPLTKNGLSIAQGLQRTAGGVACETMLLHKTGQWMADTFEVPVSKQDAQGFGSAATYCRRYSLQAMVGIAPIDDDANAAVGHGHHAPKPAAVELDPELVKCISAANTLAALQAAWESIPKGERSFYEKQKDAAKARISQGALQ